MSYPLPSSFTASYGRGNQADTSIDSCTALRVLDQVKLGDSLQDQIAAAERECGSLTSSIESARRELEKLRVDAAAARERRDAAKASARSARQAADAEVADLRQLAARVQREDMGTRDAIEQVQAKLEGLPSKEEASRRLFGLQMGAMNNEDVAASTTAAYDKAWIPQKGEEVLVRCPSLHCSCAYGQEPAGGRWGCLGSAFVLCACPA